jgi:hypothetical protein
MLHHEAIVTTAWSSVLSGVAWGVLGVNATIYYTRATLKRIWRRVRGKS